MFAEVRGQGFGDRGDEVGVWGVVCVGMGTAGVLGDMVEREGCGGGVVEVGRGGKTVVR